MILIISSCVDNTTTKVLRWLKYEKIPFIRINREDKVSFLNIEGDEIMLTCGGFNFNLSEVKAFWYRREGFNFEFQIGEELKHIDSAVLRQFTNYEKRDIEHYLYYRLQMIPHLSSFLTADVNKLIVLYEAQKLGLKIPKTLITTNGSDLTRFMNLHNNSIINKSIGGQNNFCTKENDWGLYTNSVLRENFSDDEFFFPSKFQNEIKKKYEIRTFILENICYSMAIFSQNNSKTKVDFRKYDRVVPNRNVPFNLPSCIEGKLLKLIEKFQLNCASIDIIIDEASNFIFLEINPVGQFGMVGIPCNYFLDKKVAKYLINSIVIDK
jgi:ATP-GRASP peptide maturase of grasp-with-spasm system